MYVVSVDINDGAIVVTYGNAANAAIGGRTVTLTPYETPELGVVWRCGAAPAPPGLNPLGTAAGANPATYIASTVPAHYLPPTCRA
jgi:hypothetical protein